MKQFKRTIFMLSVFTLVATTSCKNDKKEEAKLEESTDMNDNDANSTEMSSNEGKKIELTLESKSGSAVTGTVVFTQENNVVSMNAVVEGLSEGMHAIHIHEKADCTAEDGTSAGGHWNPTNQPHGKWGDAAGFHKGDIGNLNADANGKATITMSTDEWCIGCDDPNKDITGRAIIVHEGVDDFVTQPTGAAGGRQSCGGIIQ